MNIQSISQVHFYENINAIDAGNSAPDDTAFSILVVEEEIDGEVVKSYQTDNKSYTAGWDIIKTDSFHQAVEVSEEILQTVTTDMNYDVARDTINEAIKSVKEREDPPSEAS